jgi:DNA-binding LacI/PurR family transcriptional regulator
MQENLDFIETIAKRINGERSSGALTEQLFEAFSQELSGKRWRVGEFLPHPGEVAEIAGVSKASVSRSYDKLAKKGFIRRTKRKGSEVIATTPISTAQTRIGILLCNPTSKILFRSEAYAQKLALACLECAKKRGFDSKVVTLFGDQLAQPFLEASALFENEPSGIMSVGPSPSVRNTNGEAVPIMYIHRSANDLRPCVMGDARWAINLLTERAIKAGHQNIGFVGDREWAGESEIRWQFHSEFLRKAGIEPNETCYRESLQLSPLNLNEWKHWIRRHEKSVTCFISGTRIRAAEMLAAASVFLEKRMPEDFSLLSYGQCNFISESGESQVESVDHDVTSLIGVGMDILHGQIGGAYEDIVSSMVAPRWYPGTTFGPPSGKEKKNNQQR